MPGRFLFILILIPVVELVLLTQLFTRAGLLWTLLIVFSTGIIGINIARLQGTSAWRRIQQSMKQGQNPSREIVAAVLVLFAGAFLITPGILTDIVGFALLVPFLRSWIAGRLVRWFQNRTVSTFEFHTGSASFRSTSTVMPEDMAGDAGGPSVTVRTTESRLENDDASGDHS